MISVTAQRAPPLEHNLREGAEESGHTTDQPKQCLYIPPAYIPLRAFLSYAWHCQKLKRHGIPMPLGFPLEGLNALAVHPHPSQQTWF